MGTATLLAFCASLHAPGNPGAPFPKGGCKNFVDALVACARDSGVDLYPNEWVCGMTVEDDLLRRVTCKSGDEFEAREAFVSTINVRDVYDMLGDDAPAQERAHIAKIKNSDFVPLNQAFALSKIPEFKTGEAVKDAFCVEFAPEEAEYLRTFSESLLGGFSPKLPLITMPRLARPESCARRRLRGEHLQLRTVEPGRRLAEPGRRRASGSRTSCGSSSRAAPPTSPTMTSSGAGDAPLLEYTEWNPAFRDGDIGQIGMQPSQMDDYRPLPGRGHDYHGDIENLYFLGCSSHPGGAIAGSARSGIQKVLEDFGVDFRDIVEEVGCIDLPRERCARYSRVCGGRHPCRPPVSEL